MSQLAAEQIVLCKRGTPPLAGVELAALLSAVPQWRVTQDQEIPQLQRTFVFKNFVEALRFTNVIGDLAEQANHHPALLLEWGIVKVSWWTHTIKGLHRNDFILAARCDAAYSPADAPTTS
ncbi:MAG: 4a-hydroxytetrahydrobiopterin dehydratase [Pseudomonadota bacterium]